MASSLTTQRRSQRAAEESAAFGPVAERFRRAGDLDRAISLCREGLQKFPNTISARVTLGWALLDQGKFDQARVELEQVMRRAPDNLAAIRGLAELHDRAEHTMNLPMDGPGQWPPDEQAVDHAFVDAEPEMAAAISHDALTTAVQFTADADVETPPESPAVFTTEAATTPDESADLEAEADLEALIAQAVAAEVATEPTLPAETVAYAEAVEEAPAAEAVAQASAADALAQVTVDYATEKAVQETEPAQTADVVSEADIAALLAEAERLEAEAAAEEHETVETVDATGEVSGNIELEATDAVEFGAEEESFAPSAQIEAEPVAESEPEVVVEAAEQFESEPAAESVAEPVSEVAEEFIAEPMAEAAAEVVAEEEVAAEPVADVVAEPVAEVFAEEAMVEVAADDAVAEVEAVAAVEAVADVEVEAVADVAVEPVADVADEPEVEAAAEVVAFEPAAEVIDEPVAETPAPMPVAAFARVEPFVASIVNGFTIDEPVVAVAIQQAVGRTHLAEIVPMARAARAESGGNTLVALERLLAKVQARRSELMAQSVA